MNVTTGFIFSGAGISKVTSIPYKFALYNFFRINVFGGRSKKMPRLKYLAISIILAVSFVFVALSFDVHAAFAPGLGTDTSFAVLGASTVTNTGPSIINGNLGLYSGTSVTGFPPGIVVPPGTIHAADAVAQQAQSDALTAYNALTSPSQKCDVDLTGVDLGGLTLTPGVYCFSSSAGLTGKLILNAQGDPKAVWVFQIGSTLTTAPGSSVAIINPGGPQAGCNLFWQVGSSATLDTTTAFKGNILASVSITMNTDASLVGRALALNGAVTLDTNKITPLLCTLKATATPLPATKTAVAATMTVLAPTLTSIAQTPTATLSFPAQTAIATQLTALAPTASFLTETAVAVAPSQTVQSVTQTAAATTPTPTKAPSTSISSAILPKTGFAPQRVTILPAQPVEKAYANLGSLWIEIPSLNVQMPIVGVPQTNGGWDVSWLGSQAGWLNGTAFPTWAGNSVLTGHVYDAYGKPGPFVQLHQLWWGDKVIVHAWGAQYVYEVRQVVEVGPTNISSVFRHEELPWVTLITCSGYDEASNSYKYRWVVQAVLVEVE
jgi:LPXTG-site transpeptidase (sortase) family protein